MCDQSNRGDNVCRRVSSSAQLRKVNKPLVERRRRERINRSIDELKTLLVSRRQMIGASRLDKTEILELAVDELRNLSYTERRRSCDHLSKADSAYSEGYSACAHEVLGHISEMTNVSFSTRQRLIDGLGAHLRRTCSVMPHDDVTATTTRPMTDVTGAPRRRLFGYDDHDDSRKATESSVTSRLRRRPLADIQPSTCRDSILVCRSKPVSSNDCCRVPFLPPPDVAVCSGHVMTQLPAASPVTEIGSRWIRLTQTTTTMATTQHDVVNLPLNDFEPDSSLASADAKLEPMWRPW